MSRLTVCLCALFFSLTSFADPLRIAHRGGTGDAPENTVAAIERSLANGADAIWVTVQLSRDRVPVLYRPVDLDALTDLKGVVSGRTAYELARADAGWKSGGTDYPWRGKGIAVPSLELVLERFRDVPFFLDIKSPDADPSDMAEALAAVLRRTTSLARSRVYSTDGRYLDALPRDVQRFESRDLTRTALALSAMAHRCELPVGNGERWFGLELKRDVEVVEKYTLGEARSKAQLVWDKEAMECFRSKGDVRVVLFGINSEADYRQAKALGADAVMIDSPQQFRAIPR